eukprot:14763464-Alexandrium_andersonii.AAC.1
MAVGQGADRGLKWGSSEEALVPPLVWTLVQGSNKDVNASNRPRHVDAFLRVIMLQNQSAAHATRYAKTE